MNPSPHPDSPEGLDKILYDYAARRDFYYSDLKDSVITEDEWVAIRDKIQVDTKERLEEYYTNKFLRCLPKERKPTKCTAGFLCDGDMCCGGIPYENQAYNEAIADTKQAIKQLSKKGKE